MSEELFESNISTNFFIQGAANLQLTRYQSKLSTLYILYIYSFLTIIEKSSCCTPTKTCVSVVDDPITLHISAFVAIKYYVEKIA